jgi:hypothetical protein
MALVSLGQAAKLAGLGKTTLARAIKAGRLSATRRDDGGYQIDISELERVYPLRAPTDAIVANDPATGTVVHLATGDDLTGEIVALRATATLMREQIADLREDRDHWRDQAQRLALARPATPETPPATVAGDLTTPQPEPEVSRLRRTWRWLRSTG